MRRAISETVAVVATIVAVGLAIQIAIAQAVPVPPPEKFMEVIKQQQADLDERDELIDKLVKKIQQLQSATNCA